MILQKDVHLPNFLGYLALTFFWIRICISIIWFLFTSVNTQNGKGSEMDAVDPLIGWEEKAGLRRTPGRKFNYIVKKGGKYLSEAKSNWWCVGNTEWKWKQYEHQRRPCMLRWLKLNLMNSQRETENSSEMRVKCPNLPACESCTEYPLQMLSST